ncbi:cadherin-related family member 4 isoform X5 [Marmota marmota marmota]|uniref:cadherin-related family member 4 isoform X5 n=1 Tax=Marmota marmota marmota TaxID=9994 RepID=UPI002092A432|nr:cadherin-related family member 4 isoform X5 [Marmota marmota marmota]
MTVFEQLTWQQVGPDKQSPLSSLQATMVLLRLLMILLALVVSDLHSLPWFINVSEREGPGTILQSFSFNCSSHLPTLELVNVQPPTTFFNPPSLTRWQGIYVGKVTLSSSARLDALAVNHYELQLRYTCGDIVMEGPLFVDVQRDSGHIQCIGRFASSGLASGTISGSQRPGSEDLPAANLSVTWTRPKLPKNAGGEDFACTIQPGLLPKAQNVTIPEDKIPGSKVVQVQARGFNLRYEIFSPMPSPLYSIGSVDGVVQTTMPLELAHTRGAAITRLQVKAFERFQPWASAELDLTVNVLSVNHWPPLCIPALLVTQIPETTPVGTVLNTITCTDPDSVGATLNYQLWFHSSPGLASLCLRDRVLEVNATLDCDIPGTCFQHSASILVLDGGQPQMTTEVPVLVMVTPVNEFTPACAPRTFRVQEDAGPHTLLGTVVGTDMDYPHNSIEYYTSDGSSIFAVDHLSGDIHLLGTLDYEQQRLYRLTILLIDHGQDWDPTYHRSGSCTITIEVEDVNDHPPECEPPFQELTIYTTLGHSVEVTKVSCWIPQEPQRLAFSYSIIGGDSKNQFRLQEAILMHNDSMLGPPWQEQPCTYELLIRAADAGPSIPHLSTTVTIIVHLVPWRASTVAMSTQRTTVPSVMTPLLVTYTETFWQPEPWFVVVLTATGALLLLALGWLVSRLLQRLTQVLQAPSKPAQALRLNSIQGNEGSIE